MCLFRASDYYFCVFIVLVTICIIAKWINLFQKQSPDIFCKKGVLRNFAKFTGKHLYQSLQPKACNFIKKETLAQMFSCEFWEISKNTFLQNTSGQLLLSFATSRRSRNANTVFSTRIFPHIPYREKYESEKARILT